jgi:Flp pilus assembly protein TadD
MGHGGQVALSANATPVPRKDDRYQITDRTGLPMGQMSIATLHNLIRQGRLFRTDKVSKNDGPLQPLSELPEMRAVFDEVLPPAFRAGGTTMRARPELAGDLIRGGLADVLGRLFREQRTGRLFVVSADGRREKMIVFQNGVSVNAQSNIEDEQIGEVLRAQGIIDEQQFQQAVQQRRHGGGRIGSALVRLNAISPRDLHKALTVQAMERVLNAFRQREGTFRFVADDSATEEEILLFAKPRELIEAGLHAALGPDELGQELAAFGDIPLENKLPSLPEHAQTDLTDVDRKMIHVLTAKAQPMSVPIKAIASALRMTFPEVHLRVLTLIKLGAVGVSGEELGALQKALDTLQGQDYFDALGVTPTDGPEAVQAAAAARLTALGADTDASDNAAVAKLKERIRTTIAQAEGVLTDARERAIYVRSLELGLDFDAQEVRLRLDFEFLVQQGRTQMQAQQYEAARQTFQQAAERMPDEPSVYVELGWAFFLGSPRDASAAETAIAQIDRGLRLASELDSAYLTIGKIARLINDDKRAEAGIKLDIGSSGPLPAMFLLWLAITGGMLALSNYAPALESEWPDRTAPAVHEEMLADRQNRDAVYTIPAELQVMGVLEYYYLPQDAWFWGRRILLLLCGVVGVLAIRKEAFGDQPFVASNGLVLFFAVPFGILSGFLSYHAGSPTALAPLIGMAVLHVLAEQVFFVWFIARTLLKEMEEKLIACVIAGLLYGLYQLSFTALFNEPFLTSMRFSLQMGAAGGLAYAVMVWQNGGYLSAFLAQLAAVLTMLIRASSDMNF